MRSPMQENVETVPKICVKKNKMPKAGKNQQKKREEHKNAAFFYCFEHARVCARYSIHFFCEYCRAEYGFP